MRLSALTIMAGLVGLPAFAGDLPDMIGKWTGKSRAVVSGTGGHYGEGNAKPEFKEVELTIVWTEQDDDRLIGTITSPWHNETKLAVLSSDGQTLVTVDSDGTSIGRIIDEDNFELCYTQASEGATQIVVSCVDLTRVKD